MNHIRKFNERNGQLWDPDEAREVISKIYNIIDEVSLGGKFVDFLVDIDDFLRVVDQYGDNHCFATNALTIRDLKYMIENELHFTPRIMVAPFWFSRDSESLLKYEKWTIYSDTLYLVDIDELSNEYIEGIKNKLNADECGVIMSKLGEKYIRVWWD